MENIHVIVVPETDEFKPEIHDGIGSKIYINSKLGKPNLQGSNVKYVVPYFLTNKEAHFIYQILDMFLSQDGNAWCICLGNSYILKKYNIEVSQTRRFEYHPLSTFGFKEILDGFLVPIDFKI